jgi:hypothetical protein
MASAYTLQQTYVYLMQKPLDNTRRHILTSEQYHRNTDDVLDFNARLN